MKKTKEVLQQHDEQKHRFFDENRLDIDGKTVKIAFAQKVDQKRSLGTSFSTKNRMFRRFGGPWGGPWGGLGEDFGEKIFSLKKSRKKEVKVIASAGSADPGKEGF